MTSHENYGVSFHQLFHCWFKSLISRTHRVIIKAWYYWPFEQGINQWPVDSPHRKSVTCKVLPRHYVNMLTNLCRASSVPLLFSSQWTHGVIITSSLRQNDVMTPLDEIITLFFVMNPNVTAHFNTIANRTTINQHWLPLGNLRVFYKGGTFGMYISAHCMGNECGIHPIYVSAGHIQTHTHTIILVPCTSSCMDKTGSNVRNGHKGQ